MYFQQFGGSFVYLLLYIDDMLITSKDKSLITNLKSQLSDEFQMKELSVIKKILGLEIHRDRKVIRIYLSQRKYLEKVFDKFNISDCKSVSISVAPHFKLFFESCPNCWGKLRRCLMFLILVQLVVSCMLWCALDMIYPMRLVL